MPIVLLAACSSLPNIFGNVFTPNTPKQQTSAMRPVTLTAIGYGATIPNSNYTEGQKRLMAMRASKLDAYRALAEQVYGVRITSNSTIAGLAAQHDSFRAYVDAYIRGAKIVTVTPMADGNYETVLELELNEQFYQTVSQPQSQPIPQQQGSLEKPPKSEAPITVATAQNCGGKTSATTGCGNAANFYHAE
ncbi:MAG: LPP20 family lipoprotein [Sulfuricella sp.]